MSALTTPRPATSSCASSRSTNEGTFSSSTDTHLPSRQDARATTGPPGASIRTTVSGSCMGTMPVSSSTVATQIRLEPELGTYSVGSMMITPVAHPGVTGGISRFTCRQTLPRGSHSSSRRTASCSRCITCIFSKTVAPAGGSTPPTMTSPISPSAWHPTTEIVRLAFMGGSRAARASNAGALPASGHYTGANGAAPRANAWADLLGAEQRRERGIARLSRHVGHALRGAVADPLVGAERHQRARRLRLVASDRSEQRRIAEVVARLDLRSRHDQLADRVGPAGGGREQQWRVAGLRAGLERGVRAQQPPDQPGIAALGRDAEWCESVAVGRLELARSDQRIGGARRAGLRREREGRAARARDRACVAAGCEQRADRRDVVLLGGDHQR